MTEFYEVRFADISSVLCMLGYEPSMLYIRHPAVGPGLCIMLEVNFAFWAFSEVRFKSILGNLGKFTEVPGRVFSDVRMYGVLRSSRQAEGGGIICFVGRVCTR